MVVLPILGTESSYALSPQKIIAIGLIGPGEGIPLPAGDLVEMEIEGIGVLSNPLTER